MIFKQYYLGCLAHASYLIASDGEAAVVDPQRDVQQYLDEAAAQGLRLRYIIETHLHADFVSGHIELAECSGAEIVFGARAEAAFPHRAVHDGEELQLGKVVLRFLETPGHTPESISVVVIDTEVSNEPQKVLTGDTLFIGDVGRPDLAGARGYTPQEMASMLYDSLRDKLLALPDAVEVYPAHGAGSMCGRNISKETSSTIGAQRTCNYALADMTREAFVNMMTADLSEAPAYFGRAVDINKGGAPALSDRPLPPALSADAFNNAMQRGALAVDLRSGTSFGAGHVPGSINVGLQGQFASWAGSLLPADHPLLLVTDGMDEVVEGVTRLSRVGLDNVAGWLDGGLNAWSAAGLEIGTLPQITPTDLRERMHADGDGLQVVDVRRAAEYASGHVPRARTMPLSSLERHVGDLDASRPTLVVCASGYRSSAACSLLKRAGFSDVANVVGGTQAWRASGFEVESGAEVMQ